MTNRVLIFTSSGCGGSERIALTIAKILYRHRLQVRLVVYKAGHNTDLLAYIPDYLPVTYIEGAPTRGRSLVTTVRLIKREKPGYVFSSNGFIACMLISISFFFRGIKCVVRQDSMPEFINLRKARRLLYPHAHVLIAQTEEMKEQMARLYRIRPEKIKVIFNPVDTETILKKCVEPSPFEDDKSVNYVAVGRVHPDKDYITLIRAFMQVVRDIPEAHLHICGRRYDNEYMHALEELLQKHENYRSHVHFLGFTDNPYRYLNHGDCFVLSSVHEGCPNVLLESIYLKKPVVATQSIPFIKHIVQDEVNGYSVPIESPELLAAAMKSAIGLTIRDCNYHASESGVWVGLFNQTVDRA